MLGHKRPDRVVYRIASTPVHDDLPAIVPEFTQSIYSVQPSRHSYRVDGIRIFEVGNGKSVRRPARVLVYRIVVPGL